MDGRRLVRGRNTMNSNLEDFIEDESGNDVNTYEKADKSDRELIEVEENKDGVKIKRYDDGSFSISSNPSPNPEDKTAEENVCHRCLSAGPKAEGGKHTGWYCNNEDCGCIKYYLGFFGWVYPRWEDESDFLFSIDWVEWSKSVDERIEDD